MADENDPGRTGPQLTHTQAVNRARELSAEIERLGDVDDPSAEEESEFIRLAEEFESTDKWRKHLEREAARAQVRSVVDGELRTATTRYGRPQLAGKLEAGSFDTMDRDPILNPDDIEAGRFKDPWKLDEVRTFGRSPGELAAEYRSRALSAVEKMSGATDKIRSAATALIEEHDDENGSLAQIALALSDPTYMRAWSKLARSRGLATDLDAAERSTVDRVGRLARAMSLTDSAGGYLVPFQLDPTLILTANGTVNQIRSVARNVIATGDVWNGVSSGDVSWSYDAEGTEVSDDSTTFVQPTVPIHSANGFVPISRQALQDAANVTTEVGRLLARGKDNLEATAFTTGSGSGQPTGIITAMVAAGGALVVASATGDTFALADVYALDSALPERFHDSDSTAWLGHRLIWNRIRQFDTAGGAGLFAENLRLGIPDALLDQRRLTSEAMDGTYGTGENYVLVLGDFSNYVIADRIGMTVDFIPHLFGTSGGRPTNSSGWLAYVRHGAAVVNTGAFRLLNVT